MYSLSPIVETNKLSEVENTLYINIEEMKSILTKLKDKNDDLKKESDELKEENITFEKAVKDLTNENAWLYEELLKVSRNRAVKYIEE
jgi:uncharacterized coiled-coil DUF342 family protein